MHCDISVSHHDYQNYNIWYSKCRANFFVLDLKNQQNICFYVNSLLFFWHVHLNLLLIEMIENLFLCQNSSMHCNFSVGLLSKMVKQDFFLHKCLLLEKHNLIYY